jgi:hypothetical protein
MNETAKALKATVKTLVTQKVTLTRSRVEHKQAPPEEKQTAAYRAWFGPVDDERADLKYRIRHHLLAYALVRGRPYRTVEKRCADDNRPSEGGIEAALRAHDAPVVVGEVRAWLDALEVEGAPEATEAAA